MSAKITDTDKGWKKLQELIKFLKEREVGVKAGILGSAAHQGSDASVLDIALWNEFGTARIPERPFLRSTFDTKKESFYRLAFGLMKKVTKGQMPVDHMMGLVGLKMQAEIKRTITAGAGVPPPNAPSTIERKGSSRPLVDTGQLLNSITFEVVHGG